MKKWAIFAALTAVAALSVMALFSMSPAKSGNNPEEYQRIEWVDENGVVHTTILSPRPKKEVPPAGRPQPARQPMPAILSAKVQKALSGDTILLEDGQKLRYVGLRAPNKGEKGYEEALAYHKKLVQGKFVNILFDANPKDADGTLLGLVFINRMTFVNAELIRHGYAKAFPRQPNVKYEMLFKNLEERARNRKLGIWKI